MTQKQLTRLTALEAQTGQPGEFCQCPKGPVDYRRAIRDLDPDFTGEYEPVICEGCGKPKDFIPYRVIDYSGPGYDAFKP